MQNKIKIKKMSCNSSIFFLRLNNKLNHINWHIYANYILGTSCPWFGWEYSSLDKELAEWLSPESGGEQS